MFDKIRADMKRYRGVGGWYQHPGFWTTLVYRFGNWSNGIRFWPLKILFKVVYRLAATPVRCFCHVGIASSAEIGPGLLLEHPQSILIPPECRIGSECAIFHEVTFGVGAKEGLPHVADNVVVYAGARVLGGITIGEHALIGANVVIQKDVAEWAYVMPPIPRQIPAQTSKRLQIAEKEITAEKASESSSVPPQSAEGRATEH